MTNRCGMMCAVVAALGLVCGQAQAAQVMYSDTVSDSSSIDASGTGNNLVPLDLTMTLPQFDPSLGTLTGISWVDQYVKQGLSFSITNTNGTETATVDFGRGVNTPVFTEFPGPVTGGLGSGSGSSAASGSSASTPRRACTN